MPTSKSIPLNRLRAVVEQYVTENPEGPYLRIIPSHIDTNGFACGYLESTDLDAVVRIEEMADRAQSEPTP